MSKIIIGNTISKVIFDDNVRRGIIRQIKEAMTYTSPNARGYHIWRRKQESLFYSQGRIPIGRYWNGKECFLTEIEGKKFKTYTFPTGLLSVVLSQIKEYGIPVNISTDKGYIKGEFKGSLKSLVLPDGTNLWPFQKDAVRTLIENKRGICRIGTGGGKTEIICMLTQLLSPSMKVLILAHRKELISNMLDRLEKRGITDVSFYGEGSNDLDGNIVVASIPKLWQYRTTGPVKALLDSARVLICDEVHHAQSATSWYELMIKCPAPYRFGFTATTMMADEFVMEERKLQAVTGDLLVDVPSAWLMQHGFVAKPRITMIEDDDRETFISYKLVELIKAKKHLGPGLLIVRTIAEGKKITNLLACHGVKTAFVYGATSKPIRAKYKGALESGAIELLVSSVIFKEGVDIPAVKLLVNLCDEKKHRSAVQIVGRALRGSGEVFVYDFIFRNDSRAVRRALERMRAYAGEGYEVRRYRVKGASTKSDKNNHKNG